MFPFRRRRTFDPVGRDGLARALSEATFELLPLKSGDAQSAFVPDGTWVSVTASPSKGLEATVELALTLEARGYRAIPHLSARMVRDRAHLRDLLGRLTDGGVARAFVVGGDSAESGEYPDGLSLLRAIADLGVVLSNVGIPCYPEGHAFIPDDRLLQSLVEKAPFAHYMTTQLCFDPAPYGRGSPPVVQRACCCRSRSVWPGPSSRIASSRSAARSGSATPAASS